MPVETEIKIRLADPQGFRDRLISLKASKHTERHFEENFVLDTPDNRLRAHSCLMRVRRTKGRESVTFKGPPKASGLFKIREENETLVESAEVMLEIFRQLGMEIWFRYEKYREEFSVPAGCTQPGHVLVALDTTPIGDFAELEGSEEGIREVAWRLGVNESQFLRESYYSLYVGHCRQRGTEPKHMVFGG